MSFILKSPRLATGVVGLARQTEFIFRKIKILSCISQSHYKVSKTFIRCYSLAPQINASPANPLNSKENLYHKLIGQLYVDMKSKEYTFKQDVIDAWHSMKLTTSFTVPQTVTLIRSCGHGLPQEAPSEKLKLVKEIWDSFDSLGVQKTVHHYNALLAVYNELEHNFCPQNFLNDLKEQGLFPTLETYKKLLHALSIQGNIGKSQTFLEDMKINSMTIDDEVFNCLILGHSLQGDFTSACSILELMKEKNLVLSSNSYVGLALGYAKKGNIDKVKEILKECKEQEIMLSTKELLEIAYTFAVNKHSEHFSTILSMITLTQNFSIISTNIVHRLLHKNLDREALRVFLLRNKLQSISRSQETLQMFIDHFIRFREPYEVFDIAEIYVENGWLPIAFAYCIKETLLRKDISHCFNFLQSLKTRGHPLRAHYFYPILIKTHQFGNEEVLKMLKEIRKYVIFGQEGFKVFDRFYDFLPGAELNELEKIQNAGMSEKFIAWKVLDMLLHRKNINDAIKLVSTKRIFKPAVLLPTSMATGFSTEGADHKKFVYILYYLIHNIGVSKISRGLDLEVEPSEYEQFMIEIAKVCDETFNLGVLEEMLKKKIPLSSNAGIFLSKMFPSPEVTDLISKLTSGDFKFEFDETLIQRLLNREEVENRKNLLLNVRKGSLSELEEAIENHRSVPIVMRIFKKLAQEADFGDKFGNILGKLFSYVSRKGDVESTERIYEFGVQNKLLEKDNYAPCVIAYIVSGKLNDAVGRFHEGLKATKKSSGLKTLIREIKEEKNYMAMKDLKFSMNYVYGEYSGTSELLKTFAELGYIGEMTKILQMKTPMIKSLCRVLCLDMYRERNVRFLERIELASRIVPELNFTSVYYCLLNLYVLNGDLENILRLYVELERDDCGKEHFKKHLFYHLMNWHHNVPEKLKNVLQCVLEESATRNPFEDTEFVYPEENIEDVLMKEVQPSSCTEAEAVPDFINEELFECYCLIQAGKLDEYFKILRKKIDVNKPENAKKYFFCYKLVPHFRANPEYLKEYKMIVSLAERPFFWRLYLKLCVRMNNLEEIEEAMQKLDSRQLKYCIQEISVRDCLRVIQSSNSHKILKKKIAHFYSKAIRGCLKENKYEMAKKYFEKAKQNKLGFLLYDC